jgi:hypothetical protein
MQHEISQLRRINHAGARKYGLPRVSRLFRNVATPFVYEYLFLERAQDFSRLHLLVRSLEQSSKEDQPQAHFTSGRGRDLGSYIKRVDLVIPSPTRDCTWAHNDIKALYSLFRLSPNLLCLSLQAQAVDTRPLFPKFMDVLVSQCRNLRYIHWYTSAPMGLFMGLTRFNPGLEVLSLSSSIRLQDFIGVCLPLLHTLQLQDESAIGVASLWNLPSLRRLTIVQGITNIENPYHILETFGSTLTQRNG